MSGVALEVDPSAATGIHRAAAELAVLPSVNLSSIKTYSLLEVLEPRIAPAGNVIAQVVGGQVLITGDAEDNAIEITGYDDLFDLPRYRIAPGDPTTTINGGSEPVMLTDVPRERGDVLISMGAGNDTVRVPTNLDVGRDLRIDGGVGNNIIEVVTADVPRHFVVTNGSGDDLVKLDKLSARDLVISNGKGSSNTAIGALNCDVSKDVRISNGAGAEFTATLLGRIVGNVSITAPKAGLAHVRVGWTSLEVLGCKIFGELAILTGAGSDDVTLRQMAASSATVFTGHGADTILIEDSSFRLDLNLATGAGSDAVVMERDPHSVFPTTIDRQLQIGLGNGDDFLQLGRPGSIATVVQVTEQALLSGGTGLDRLDLAGFESGPEFPKTDPGVVSVTAFEQFGQPPLFGEPALYETGDDPIDVLSADLNGDGNLDLVSSNNGGDSISVFFGDGRGRFSEHMEIPVGQDSVAVAVGDLDGKNGNDLVVSYGADALIGVLLNEGGGQLSGPVMLDNGGGVAAVKPVVADFNGDGRADLATLKQPGFNRASVTVLLGMGDGSFSTPREFALTAPDLDLITAIDFEAGDLNGDGQVDLAASLVNGFAVLLGNGDGTFSLRVESRQTALDFHLADVNGDAKLDLLVQTSGPALRLGNGDGTFQPPTLIWATSERKHPITADFDGDGLIDISLIRDGSNGEFLQVLLGNGDGTFLEPLEFRTRESAGPIAVGDFDGDHSPDLAVVGHDRIAVLLNETNGRRTF